MRLSELIASTVVDVAGEPIGGVGDVRLVQDGPYQEAFGPALRVEGLVAGRQGLAARLGYDRGDVKGPWLLRTLFRRSEARARYVAWEQIAEIRDGVVHLSVRADALRKIPR
jgi:hypothetical protein